MQKITPFLWFDDKAEEAMNFYVSLFRNSKVGSVTRYGDEDRAKANRVMQAMMQMDKIDIAALQKAYDGT